MRQTAGELLASLERARARAVVFPMHEPAGYPPANDRVLEAADGVRRPARRVLPRRPARRRAAGGAPLPGRGRARDQAAPAGGAVHAVRAGRARRWSRSPTSARVPVLIHAGRGIPALGRDTVRLSRRVPGRAADPRARGDLRPRVAVARAARPPEPVHRHGVVGPGRHDGPVHARAAGELLWASDAPYGLPLTSAVLHLRLAAQAGLDTRGAALDRGRADRARCSTARPGRRRPAAARPRPLDPLLERVVSHTAQAVARMFGAGRPEEPVALARLACGSARTARTRTMFAAVLELLDLYEANLAPAPEGRRFPLALRLLLAACTGRAHARRAAPRRR